MARGVGGRSPSNIMTHLKGIHFPARKSDLLSQARNNNAPSEVLDQLNQLGDDQEFGGPQDVMKAYKRA